jgi:hypothetical protein
MRTCKYVVLCCLLGTTACAVTNSPPTAVPQPKCHVAYLVGPFRYPYSKQDVADELRTRGWQIADKLAPGVDTVVVGQEPTVATCGGFVDRVERVDPGDADRIDGFDLLRCPGCEIVYWSRLQVQLLCDDLAR